MRRYVVLWVWLASAVTAWGQEVTVPPGAVLTLEQAVTLALQHNRLVKNAALEVEKATDRVAAARTHFFPALEVQVLASYLLTSIDFTFKRGAFGTFPDTGPIPAEDVTISIPRRPHTFVTARVTQPLSSLYRIGLGVRLQARLKGAQAQVEEATLALQDSALKAPFNAVVLKRLIEVGTLVGPASVAFVLADTAAVKAVFGVPDTMVQRLQVGHTLVISTAAVPGVEFRGPITRISPPADPKSRAFEVEVTLPNPRSQLKIGSIGSIQVVEAQTTSPAFVVPLSAIVRSTDQPTGYTACVVQEQDGKQVARLCHVKLGNIFGNMVAVLEGVTSGERVITTGTALVMDGAPGQIISSIQ